MISLRFGRGGTSRRLAMQIAVFLEKVNGNGFRATCDVPLGGLVVEAPTREEALSRAKELICKQLERGEVVRIDVPLPGEPNPWLAIAGTWKDHPDIEEVEENIREYRRQLDEDPDLL